MRILIVHALSSITSSAAFAESITSPTVLVVLSDSPRRPLDELYDDLDLERELRNFRIQAAAPRHSSFPAEPTYPLRLPAPRLPPAMPRLRRVQNRG